MASYAPDLRLRDARQIYFDVNGFKNGGYDDKWVKLKAGPFTFAFPNTAARIRSVRLHDLHHVATEYDTTWEGEAEIAAWELATGCRNHWPVIPSVARDLAARVARRTTAQFPRYARDDRTLLDGTVAELRQRLRLDGK